MEADGADTPPEPVGPKEEYEVVHKKVVVRSQPRIESAALSVVKRGGLVSGTPHRTGGDLWLLLDGETKGRLWVKESGGWMLIDGTRYGVSELLRRVEPKPEVTEAEDMAAAQEARSIRSLEECEQFRAQAERLLSRRQYQAAVETCQRGLSALKDLDTGARAADVDQLQVSLLCGAARALLRCGDRGGPSNRAATGLRAHEMASRALELEPCNCEALFLRGCASAAAGDLQAARTDLERAVRMDPESALAARELETVRERQLQEQDQELPGFTAGLDPTAPAEQWRRSASTWQGRLGHSTLGAQ